MIILTPAVLSVLYAHVVFFLVWFFFFFFFFAFAPVQHN